VLVALYVHSVVVVKRRKTKAGHSSSASVTDQRRSKPIGLRKLDAAALTPRSDVVTDAVLHAPPVPVPSVPVPSVPVPVDAAVVAVPPRVVARKTLELRAERVADPFGGGPESVRDFAATSEPCRSEESLRPMTLDDEFFSRPQAPDTAPSADVPHLAAIGANDLTEAERAAHRLARLGDKRVVARRESNRRKVTMGLAALALVVGVGGVVRASVRAYGTSASQMAFGASSTETLPALQVATNTSPESPVQLAPTAVARPPVAAVDIPSAESVEAPAAVVEAAPQLTDKERRDAGRKAKLESQNRLDRGDAKSAIEAGERSVSVDPSDAEAWLLLGAAYQQVGDLRNASRAFSACLKDATRGDKSDCAAMLRLKN
jgi:hypothetical protein